MKRLFFSFLVLVLAFSPAGLKASMSITPWTPLYKGIDHAVGTNYPDAAIPTLQVANCLKIDLRDPDVQLFTTPRISNYLANSRETPSAAITTFIKRYGVQVATDANFYNAVSGIPSDPSSEGIACNLYGLAMSNGEIVSAADSTRAATLLFTTNKIPSFVFNNLAPGTNTAGIFTAVTGYYPVLSNGVNVGVWASNNPAYPDPEVHTANPRTIFGVSQDKRYFYMIVIDGRQNFSTGSTDYESGIWASAFGAWEAINMDGGGSSAMYMADCAGNPVALNHSSYLALGRGRERYVGNHLGVYAKPLPDFINDVKVVASDTSASILWTTLTPATASVDYGLSTGYGSSRTNSLVRTRHVTTLTGLTSSVTNYFRINAWANGNQFIKECSFVTSNLIVGSSLPLFDTTKAWRYTAQNLDGLNWTALNYNDSTWSGPGPGLLYFESNQNVAPRSTLLPANPSNPSVPYVTYYFRTHFNVPAKPAGATLLFSNSIDDGAVFYLNGFELYRLRMPQTTVLNNTTASGTPCNSAPFGNVCYQDACTNCPDIFTVPAAALTNLVVGDNLLAVEVHNSSASSPDFVFGTALFLNTPNNQPPKLNILGSDGTVSLWWNGAGVLQESSQLGANASWADTQGPVTSSPYTTTNPVASKFYRLRN